MPISAARVNPTNAFNPRKIQYHTHRILASIVDQLALMILQPPIELKGGHIVDR